MRAEVWLNNSVHRIQRQFSGIEQGMGTGTERDHLQWLHNLRMRRPKHSNNSFRQLLAPLSRGSAVLQIGNSPAAHIFQEILN